MKIRQTVPEKRQKNAFFFFVRFQFFKKSAKGNVVRQRRNLGLRIDPDRPVQNQLRAEKRLHKRPLYGRRARGRFSNFERFLAFLAISRPFMVRF